MFIQSESGERLQIQAASFRIKGYRASAQIGCAADELGIKQEVVIDAVIRLYPGEDLFEDTRSMPYDYLDAISAIEEAVAAGHHILQEALAFQIASRILEHPRARAVEISTLKTQRYPGTEGVGFDLSLSKDDQ